MANTIVLKSKNIEIEIDSLHFTIRPLIPINNTNNNNINYSTNVDEFINQVLKTTLVPNIADLTSKLVTPKQELPITNIRKFEISDMKRHQLLLIILTEEYLKEPKIDPNELIKQYLELRQFRFINPLLEERYCKLITNLNAAESRIEKAEALKKKIIGISELNRFNYDLHIKLAALSLPIITNKPNEPTFTVPANFYDKNTPQPKTKMESEIIDTFLRDNGFINKHGVSISISNVKKLPNNNDVSKTAHKKIQPITHDRLLEESEKYFV